MLIKVFVRYRSKEGWKVVGEYDYENAALESARIGLNSPAKFVEIMLRREDGYEGNSDVPNEGR